MVNRMPNCRHRCWGRDFDLSTDRERRRPRPQRLRGAGTKTGQAEPHRTGTSRPSARKRGRWWWAGECRSRRRRGCWRDCRRREIGLRQPRLTRRETAAAPSWSPRPATSPRPRCPPRCCRPATANPKIYLASRTNIYSYLHNLSGRGTKLEQGFSLYCLWSFCYTKWGWGRVEGCTFLLFVVNRIRNS